jgi:hypothetical protein
MAMRLRNLTYVVLALLAFAPPAFAQSIHTMPVGTEAEGKARIGRYEVPLPPGKWALIGAHEALSQPTSGGLGRAIAYATLVRIENNRLVGYISAVGPMTPNNIVRVWDMECRRTDLYFVESDPNNNPKVQTCFSVYHIARTWTAVPNMSKVTAAAYEWLNARPEVLKPSTMLVARHSNARDSDYLQVEYSFSPEAYGFAPSRDRSWAGNDWHRDKLKHDPARDAFAQAVLAWTKANQSLVLDGLIRRSTSAGAPLAFAQPARSSPLAALPVPPGHVVPAAGTRFATANGHFDVAQTDGMTITTVNSLNTRVTWQLGGLIVFAAGSRVDLRPTETFFPLTVGKSVELREDAANGPAAWRHKLAVVREETLPVDGRNLRAFVIEFVTESLHPSQGGLIRKRTLWYAPDIGWTLRQRDEQISGPPLRAINWDVVRIVPPS